MDGMDQYGQLQKLTKKHTTQPTDSILVFLLREAFGVRRSSFALLVSVMDVL
jgi:hypothetical protein